MLAPIQIGVKFSPPVETRAPTPKRMAVEGMRIDRNAVVSAAAKIIAIQSAQALLSRMKSTIVSTMPSIRLSACDRAPA